MILLLKIICFAGPLLLGTYLSTLSITGKKKLLVWILCLSFSLCGLILLIEEWREGKEKDKEKNFYSDKIEETYLFSRGLPREYVNGLGEHPLLKHFFNEARRYEQQNEYEKAVLEYKKCLKHPDANVMNLDAANILIGNSYYDISEFGSAEIYYREALKIHKDIKDKDEKLNVKSLALSNIGLIRWNKGDLDRALKNHQDALKIDREIGSRWGEAAAQGNIGLIFWEKGDLHSAFNLFKDALKISREIGYRQGEALSLGNIGLILWEKGDLYSRLKYLQEALKINREIGSRWGEAADLNNIGIIYTVEGNLEKGLKYHQDALKISREISFRQGKAVALCNIGHIYREKGDLDRALKYHQDALKIVREIDYKKGEALALGNIGIIFWEKGDLYSPLKYLQEALKIDREIGYKKGEAVNLCNIGLIYKGKGDSDSALKYLREAIAILEKHHLLYRKSFIKDTINEIESRRN